MISSLIEFKFVGPRERRQAKPSRGKARRAMEQLRTGALAVAVPCGRAIIIRPFVAVHIVVTVVVAVVDSCRLLIAAAVRRYNDFIIYFT